MSRPAAAPPETATYQCTLAHEQELWAKGLDQVAGVDEAGRGPLAGPVVAAAVILPRDFTHPHLNDSKQLNHARREELFEELSANKAVVGGVAAVEPAQIDTLNILRATHLAMKLAVEALAHAPAHLLVDGLPVQGLPIAHTPLVKGDARSLSIAAASVFAKVTRDRLMLQAHQQYPLYGFDRHKGYGTPQHLQALQTHGPCPLHRQSFAPVAQLQLAL